jgi:hypothetical protein
MADGVETTAERRAYSRQESKSQNEGEASEEAHVSDPDESPMDRSTSGQS